MRQNGAHEAAASESQQGTIPSSRPRSYSGAAAAVSPFRHNGAMPYENLMRPPPTLLPHDPAAAAVEDGTPGEEVARAHPASSLAWAELAERALADGADVPAYAYARVGYHRGLDALRRNGWQGHGPVPWSHEPNRGFLRCLAALATASDRIGDTDEATRCREFLHDADPEAPVG